MKNPLMAIKMFQDQLNQTIKGMHEDSVNHAKSNNPDKMAVATDNNFPKKVALYYVNFEGNFGKNHITPRGLRSELMNNFVAV
jgi:hypothetical protein